MPRCQIFDYPPHCFWSVHTATLIGAVQFNRVYVGLEWRIAANRDLWEPGMGGGAMAFLAIPLWPIPRNAKGRLMAAL